MFLCGFHYAWCGFGYGAGERRWCCLWLLSHHLVSHLLGLTLRRHRSRQPSVYSSTFWTETCHHSQDISCLLSVSVSVVNCLFVCLHVSCGLSKSNKSVSLLLLHFLSKSSFFHPPSSPLPCSLSSLFSPCPVSLHICFTPLPSVFHLIPLIPIRLFLSIYPLPLAPLSLSLSLTLLAHAPLPPSLSSPLSSLSLINSFYLSPLSISFTLLSWFMLPLPLSLTLINPFDSQFTPRRVSALRVELCCVIVC